MMAVRSPEMSPELIHSRPMAAGTLNWDSMITSCATTGTANCYAVICKRVIMPNLVIMDDTKEDISWACTHAFESKIDQAFENIKNGDFQSFDTIDDLLDYLNDKEKRA